MVPHPESCKALWMRPESMDLPTGTPCQLCWGLCAQPPWCCALGTGLRYRSPFLLLGMGRAPSGTQGPPVPVPPTWGWSHLVPCATHPVLRPPRPCVTHPGPWPPLSAGVASRKNPSQAVGSKKQEWSWLWSTCTRSSCSERDKTGRIVPGQGSGTPRHFRGEPEPNANPAGRASGLGMQMAFKFVGKTKCKARVGFYTQARAGS